MAKTKNNIPLEKAISKIAALGVPGLIFIIAVAAAGGSGAAAITAALASLGPGGMVGGIAFLGVVGVITNAITEYGVDAIFTGVVKELYLQGESKESIKEKVSKYPISKGLKLKLFDTLDNIQVG
jgi:aldehyde:ferredoxin oxidoreductase